MNSYIMLICYISPKSHVFFIDFPLKFKPISGKAKRLSGRSGGLRGDLEAHAGSGEAGAKPRATDHGYVPIKISINYGYD